MPLDDILFSEPPSAQVSRGNGGVLVDATFDRMVAFVSPSYFGGYWSVSETFKDSADTNVPDGTVVHAFHGTTHALVGSGTTAAGVAAFQVSTSADVYLVLATATETVRTLAVTPA